MERNIVRVMVLGNAKSVHVQKFISIYQEKGFEVFIATICPEEKIKVTQFAFKSLNRIISYLKLAFFFPFLVRKFKPDFIHSHYATFYGFIAAISLYKPHLLSAYGSDIYQKRGFFNFLTRIALFCASVVTHDSKTLGKRIEEMIGTERKRKKTVFLPFGVNTQIFKKKKIYETIKKFTIVSTRSLEPLYDVETLVRAVPDIIKSYPNTNFIIIGKGSQTKKIENLTRELGIENNICFIKRFLEQKDFMQYFLTANIYVSTSLSDSTSVSLLEAMSSCLIPVITDLPDNREWIRPGINGFVFRKKKPKDLAANIKLAISSYSNMTQSLKENRSLIIQKASIEYTSKRIDQIISVF